MNENANDLNFKGQKNNTNSFYEFSICPFDNDNEEEKEIKIDEKTLRENVIGKIYKILPQDIICILPDNNIIKKKYKNENIFSNLKDYINYIKSLNKEENIIKI